MWHRFAFLRERKEKRERGEEEKRREEEEREKGGEGIYKHVYTYVSMDIWTYNIW
jgi:hypothetical protein